MLERKKLLVLTVLTVAVLGGGSYALLTSSQPSQTPAMTPSDPFGTGAVAEQPPAEDPAARDDLPPSEEGLPTVQTGPGGTTPPGMPAVPEENYEEDLAEAPESVDMNPSGDDDSMASFAQELSGLMEHALESEKDALPAFAELEKCAGEGTQQNIQTQLICYANASRLSKEYPALLGNRFVNLSRQNPKLVGLLETTGVE